MWVASANPAEPIGPPERYWAALRALVRIGSPTMERRNQRPVELLPLDERELHCSA
jgi:hypothetical protein